MLKEDPGYLSSSIHILLSKSGQQLKIPKSKYDCPFHHVITPDIHILIEHILGCTSSSGFIGNTWTALSSLGLQQGFSFLFSLNFVVFSFFLHCYVCNTCPSLNLNLCHLYVLFLVLLTHCGHAGWGQACCLAVAAVGCVHLYVAAHAGISS